MQRCSESIAALASALAKAQAQLINPEKTLTAVLRPSRAGERERTFRYAPLSTGLDIVRKTLGEHEIATLQTTSIDQNSGILNLTTTLAHASGEWVASVWPVCPVSETAAPQRMGAALTYARRYALFTLVGIAGEDDLDAPDLDQKPLTGTPGELAGNEQGKAVSSVPHRPGNGRLERGGAKRSAIREELSASLRETLIAQIAKLGSHDATVSWARTALAAKNSLTAGDAKLVEEAFEERLSVLLSAHAEEGAAIEVSTPSTQARKPSEDGTEKTNRARPQRVSSGSGMVGRQKRQRNKTHLLHVAQQPCLICARKPTDPHHLRFMQPRALGLKVSDEFTVPLCRAHHREAHHAGDERAWWQKSGIDAAKIAQKLWEETRGAGEKNQPRAKEPSGSPEPAVVAPPTP
jgi:ERF superfamily